MTALGQEVEELSIKNEQFLVDLKKRDFYLEYAQVMKDLKQLKTAHMMLINLIND